MMKYKEPAKKKVVTFFDCQNLFRAAKSIWGYPFPNFDPIKLSKSIVSNFSTDGWRICGIRLYTGVHVPSINQGWAHFWNEKLKTHLKSDSRVFTFTRPLRYDACGIPREKGVDIRIALDLVRMARLKEYDVAILFSQDADFSEAADEIRLLAKEQSRWIKIASAFPFSATSNKTFGVPKTDWIRIQKSEYDACIDTSDYRI